MKDKEYFLKELNRRGYDNPKLSDLNLSIYMIHYSSDFDKKDSKTVNGRVS